jgi:hypothetical protein
MSVDEGQKKEAYYGVDTAGRGRVYTSSLVFRSELSV